MVDSSIRGNHYTVLQVIKLTTGSERNGIERIESLQTDFSDCITFANNLESGETPSNSASHQAPDNFPL